MSQSISEKKDRFSRIFPKRVETLVKTADLLVNCTSKSNYEWNEDTVKRVWIEVAKVFKTAARAYGLELTVMLNGDEVEFLDTSKKLEEQVQLEL